MDFLDRLEQVLPDGNEPGFEQLKAAINSLGDLSRIIPSYCTDSNKLPYSRNVLMRNENYEIVVINLPMNRTTSIHDHGDSFGCVFVVQGELLNLTYELDSNGYPQLKEELAVKSGNFLEAARGQIHEIKNVRKESMISLHMYSPPLQNVKAYTPYCEVLDYVI